MTNEEERRKGNERVRRRGEGMMGKRDLGHPTDSHGDLSERGRVRERGEGKQVGGGAGGRDTISGGPWDTAAKEGSGCYGNETGVVETRLKFCCQEPIFP